MVDVLCELTCDGCTDIVITESSVEVRLNPSVKLLVHCPLLRILVFSLVVADLFVSERIIERICACQCIDTHVVDVVCTCG